MTDPNTAFDSVRNAIENSSYLDEVDDILIYEPEYENEDTQLSQPWVAIYPIDVIRSSPHDTDLIGYVTQGGDRVGKRFRATFEVPLQIDVYASRTAYDINSLGYELWRALRPYDAKNEGQTLPKDDGTPLDDARQFLFDEGGRDDDFASHPNLGIWRSEAMLTFIDEVENTDDYDTIEIVHTPTDMTGNDSDGGWTIEYEYNP